MSLSRYIEWRMIEHFPNYQVSEMGQVRSIRSGRLMKINSQGAVELRRDGVPYRLRVGRLVCEAFVGPMPLYARLKRKDRDPKNNAATNLSWHVPYAKRKKVYGFSS